LLSHAQHRDQLRRELWDIDQPPPQSLWSVIRARAAKAAKTRWRWLARRRASALCELVGVTDPKTTARQILDWVNSEKAIQDTQRALVSFEKDHPDDLITQFNEAAKQWQLASVATTRARVHDGNPECYSSAH